MPLVELTVVKEIAQKYNKSPAEILLRHLWCNPVEPSHPRAPMLNVKGRTLTFLIFDLIYRTYIEAIGRHFCSQREHCCIARQWMINWFGSQASLIVYESICYINHEKFENLAQSVVSSRLQTHARREHREHLQRLKYGFRSRRHILTTEKMNKIALNPYDDKRHIIPGQTDTLPLGHYSIASEHHLSQNQPIERQQQNQDMEVENIQEEEEGRHDMLVDVSGMNHGGGKRINPDSNDDATSPTPSKKIRLCGGRSGASDALKDAASSSNIISSSTTSLRTGVNYYLPEPRPPNANKRSSTSRALLCCNNNNNIKRPPDNVVRSRTKPRQRSIIARTGYNNIMMHARERLHIFRPIRLLFNNSRSGSSARSCRPVRRRVIHPFLPPTRKLFLYRHIMSSIRFVFLGLLAVLCLQQSVDAAVNQHNLVVGGRVWGDYLIQRVKVDKKSAWLRHVSESRTFSGDGTSRISQIQVLDQKHDGTGAYATLVTGGPGQTFATLKFKSQKSHGIHFVVELYAAGLIPPARVAKISAFGG
ncbi:unnamed protein product [Trichogramma brassicae]|uniref:NADP-dependent oxidoreductase domain-containing protein n=1 Tax=Trichogramma brassicae TaxID=86971 RepID=A0A6H5J572_9HYME|nr:unnamed protein product [Trichogramma brassicae]